MGPFGVDGTVLLQGSNQAASTATKPVPLPQPQPNEAERAWGLAKDATDVAVLEAFVARYKDSFMPTWRVRALPT